MLPLTLLYNILKLNASHLSSYFEASIVKARLRKHWLVKEFIKLFNFQLVSHPVSNRHVAMVLTLHPGLPFLRITGHASHF